MTTYHEFLESRTQVGNQDGFKPVWLPDFLFDFQRALVEWSVLKGRSAIFADCGLGKTAMQLVWAENVIRHTNRPVLILTPLAVGGQTIREAAKFGIVAMRSHEGQLPLTPRVVITNYERLHYFKPSDFAGVVCDESSILKNFDGKTKAEVTEFMRTVQYRLLCTATAAPNDYVELGTSAEALGEMGFQDMANRFFKKQTSKDHLGWGRTKYAMRPHAQKDFWRWVCSWARAVRKPSDLGFDDGKFELPELITREHEVKASKPAPGRLFDVAAVTLEEQREETRRTLPERCEKVAALIAKVPGCSIAWCHLNDEGDELERLIPESVQVSGSDSDEWKETVIDWFIGGVCICQLKRKRNSVKLAECGKSNTKKIDDESANSILNIENESNPTGQEHRKKIENTCAPTIWPTSTNGQSGAKNSKKSTMPNDEQNTKQTKPHGSKQGSKSKNGKQTTQKKDERNASENTALLPLTMTACSQSKREDAQFVGAKENSTSIIVTRPQSSEESCASDATSVSDNSATILSFSSGQLCTCGHLSGKRVLISKPKMFGHGLNLQHCNHMTFFPSHSFEQFYQGVRRCWRFGQTKPVTVDLVTTDGGADVLANLRRKADAADAMFAELVKLMNDSLRVKRGREFPTNEEIPSWL